MIADSTPGRNSGSVTPPLERPGRTTLPDQRLILSWIFVGRCILALAALLVAALRREDHPDDAFLISIAVVMVLILTVYGAWVTLIRRRTGGPLFLQVQSLVDLGLVTALVHYAGASQGIYPALYVVTVVAYMLLLPMVPGVLTAVLASALYLGAAYWDGRETADATFWAQLVVFNVVFAIVAVLGHRLRAASEEQATLEFELRRVRLEADEILRNIRSGVLTVDGLGRLAFINPTAARLLDLDGEALVGLPILDEIKQRSPELWAAVVAGIRNGRKISRGEGMVSHAGGRTFPIGLSTTTFKQETQDAMSVTAIFTDISDLKQLHDLHLRTERLEAVAALSASLAHEIRNPLASIRSSVEQLARSTYADDDERFLAGLIVRESDRLSRLLSEFLDFSRVRASHFAPVDLHEIALAVVRLVRAHPDCPEEAELAVEGGPTVLEGDEDLLHRVLANLVLNAVQAARGPVRVTVSVGPADTGSLPHATHLEHAVRLQVRDDGPGIPPEVRERLFEPFVSGRPGGSGLGLAIVQRAVEAHRGLVLVDSEAGRGTTFTIILPVKLMAEDAA